MHATPPVVAKMQVPLRADPIGCRPTDAWETTFVPPTASGNRRCRHWLAGLLAGLLALAAVVAPAQHNRMMLQREAAMSGAVAAMQAGHAHHPQAPAGGQHEHVAAPACFACMLVAAPGLPTAAFAGLARSVTSDAAEPGPQAAPAVGRTARSPQHARAPPAFPT